MSVLPISQLIRYHSQRKPTGSIAISHSAESLSWTDLDRNSNRRARYFQSKGVQPGDFVTIALANSSAYFENSFAIWKAGAIPNVISPSLPARELHDILELVRPRIVIADTLKDISEKVVGASDSVDHLSAEPLDELPLASFWKAITSGGSTGRPKVVVDHEPPIFDPNLPILGQPLDGVVLNPGPLYHNAPFSLMHTALFAGCKVVGMERFAAETALQLISSEGVQWVNFVPTMMNRIMKLPPPVRLKYDMKSLVAVWHMASAMPPWLKEEWLDWLGPERVFELYGGTERRGRTVISGDEWLRKMGSVGLPCEGCSMKIVDEYGEECAPGETGEIYFIPEGGPGSTYHYIGEESKVLPGGWESFGDIGRVDEDGYLFLADRRSDLIIRGGANIYPAEIESALEAHESVGSAIVVGLPDDDLGQSVHAIISIRPPGTQLDPIVFRKFLAERLSSYKVPASFEFVDESLRDDAGKARRAAFRDERTRWMQEGVAFQTFL